jgi:hypothetical protein
VSPSWRDRVHVFVAPRALRLAVRPRGWRRVAGETISLALPEDAAVDAAGHELATALAAHARRGFDAHIVLSNAHVRYAVVADAGLLSGNAERDAAARQALRSVYGEAADDWHIVMDEGSAGAALVAGVARGLLEALRNACAAAGAGRVHIEPLFACAANAALREIDRDTGWLGVLEGGRVVLATVDAQGVAGIRTHRVLRNASDEIAALLQRARLLDGAPPERSTVLLASEQPADVVFAPESGLRLRQLALGATLVAEAA